MKVCESEYTELTPSDCKRNEIGEKNFSESKNSSSANALNASSYEHVREILRDRSNDSPDAEEDTRGEEQLEILVSVAYTAGPSDTYPSYLLSSEDMTQSSNYRL